MTREEQLPAQVQMLGTRCGVEPQDDEIVLPGCAADGIVS